MSDDGNPPVLPHPSSSAPPARRGCFFYGCLSVAILALVLVLVAGLTFYIGKRTAERLVRDYTEATPGLLEKVELPPAEMDALQRRWTTFKDALDAGQTSAELVLTAQELNALISQNKELKDRLFVRIHDERVTGEVSIPLEHDLGPLKLKDRYLNGTATFKVSLSEGFLDVRVEDIQVKSKPLPSVFMRELRKQNLALDYQRNHPQVATNVAKFESVQIQDGKVVLRSKGAQPKQ
jgi:hypothetical protein